MLSYWFNKNVLVLGGAGFIGSHLVERLVQFGANVNIIDNFSRGKRNNLNNVIEKVFLWDFDLEKSISDWPSYFFQKQDVVFNLTAKVTGIEYNRSHHEEMFYHNMLLQMLPIKEAYENGIKKFVQVSTACIYPHDSIIPTPETEGDKGNPEPTNEGYGWAKRMGEKLAFFYATKGMTNIVVRFFNAFGPRDYYDDETSHVVPAIIKKVLSNRPFTVWGSGNQTRSLVDVRDIAKGLMLIAENVNEFDIVNIGHDREVSIKDIVETVQYLTGIHQEVTYDTNLPEGYPRRSCDMTKLLKITNWSPEILFEQTIKDMINDYQSR